MSATLPPVHLPARYQLIGRIAAGGMATVYAAQDTLLRRRVAVKVLGAHVAAAPAARERFAREARAAARVSDHPHVVTVYDVGEHDDLPFIVMEHFSGGTLAGRLRSGAAIEPRQALAWLDDAASAIDHAHRHGIVHRDVKPANLLLDGHDRVAVGDFGIASMASDTAGLTQTGQVMGTAAYLSPEQALGQAATAASDRYALAVVAYELLTGERPFTGDTVAAQALAHVNDEPPAASTRAGGLPTAIDTALARGLDKDPHRRWPTAGALVAALREALRPAPGPRTAPMRALPRSAQAPPPGRRWRRTPLVALLVVLLAAGAAAAALTVGGGTDPGTSAADTTARQTRERTTPRSTPTPAPADTPTPAPAGDPSALQAQGHELIAQQRYDEAIATLQQAVQDCPVARTDPCAYAYYDLGHALRLAGRPAEAIPVLQTRRQNPDQAGTVQAELDAALEAAGQSSASG